MTSMIPPVGRHKLHNLSLVLTSAEAASIIQLERGVLCQVILTVVFHESACLQRLTNKRDQMRHQVFLL